jgi:hypothetical protein
MLTIALIILVAAVVIIYLQQRKKKSAAAAAPQVFKPAVAKSNKWTIAYSKNVPDFIPDSGIVAFPNKDGLHYVMKSGVAVNSGQEMILRFAIEGTGKLVATANNENGHEDGPARLRLYMQRKGDKLGTTAEDEQDKRWWSQTAIELVGQPGTEFVLAVPLTPAAWSNVNGTRGDARFEGFMDCVKNVQNVGFTFGGMFAGHGVFCKEGEARFVLRSFTVS